MKINYSRSKILSFKVNVSLPFIGLPYLDDSSVLYPYASLLYDSILSDDPSVVEYHPFLLLPLYRKKPPVKDRRKMVFSSNQVILT